MGKLVLVVFGLLTMGSVMLSTSHFGVLGPDIDKPSSVRQGSSHFGFFVGGSSGRGK